MAAGNVIMKRKFKQYLWSTIPPII